jgi:diguanylate cyclase (GGDEF)-like protein
LLAYTPYLLSAVGVVLAFQFNRSRFLLLALFTAGCFWTIRDQLQVSLEDAAALEVYLSIALAWPLAMLLLLLVPERGIINRWGFVYAVALGVLALAAPRLVNLIATLLSPASPWLATWPSEHVVLPRLMSVLFVGTFVLGILLLLWRDDETEVAILSTLGAGAAVLGGLHLSYISLAMISAAGLVQLSCILRSSYAMAYRDELTGLLGRRALNEKLKGLGPRYSLAMLDVDHFKKFNDTHGHDVGDEVLKMVASRIARVGAGGTAFRYGGEEFCVVFPRKNAEQCVEALETIRESVANYRMTLRDKGKRPVKAREGERRRGNMATKIKRGTVAVTISLGLAERSEELFTPEEVIKAADKQLYRAKQAGRNKLCY